MSKKTKRSKRSADQTIYSLHFPGDLGNHEVSIRADITGGYIGLTATEGDWNRLLISPAQWKHILAFVREFNA